VGGGETGAATPEEAEWRADLLADAGAAADAYHGPAAIISIGILA